MNKLRLLITERCNRNCVGCCNKQWNLKKLPIITDFTPFTEVMITGGEPMLFPDKVIETAEKIRLQNDSSSIFIYTAKVDEIAEVFRVLHEIDGITLTLHDNKDITTFLEFHIRLLHTVLIDKSLRLNVFKGVDLYINNRFRNWKIKDNIEWLENCPLPEGEIFGRI